MPDPALLEAIGGLSATGLFILAIYALYTRKVRPGSEAVEIEKRHEASMAELRADRDAWRGVAEGYRAEFGLLTDLIKSLLKPSS